jgi:glycosyltransferase involved in cell wall biosynthesis
MSKAEVVLLRSLHCDPEPRLDRVTGVLKQLGCRCTVLAWDRQGNSTAVEERGGVSFFRSQISSTYGTGLKNLGPMLKWHAWVIGRLFDLRPQVIHACDLDTLIPAAVYARLTGVPIIYDIFDFFADSRKSGWLSTVLRPLERLLARLAKRVIIAHEERQVQLGKRFPRKKVVVVYNTPADTRCSSREQPTIGRYFAHIGNLAKDRGLDYMCSAVQGDQALQLIIGGYGEEAEAVRTRAVASDNLHFIGRVDHEKALAVQSGAIGLIALYDPAIPNNRLAAPNKLYEAMMLGRPIVTNEGTIAATVVKNEGIGICVPYGLVENLRQALQWLFTNPQEAESMGIRARKLYETRYSGMEMERRIERVYRDALAWRVCCDEES